MRWLALLPLLAGLVAALPAADPPAVALPGVPLPPGPEGEARAALAYLTAEEDAARREKRTSDATYKRFASFRGVPEGERKEFLKTDRLWTRHLTLGPDREANWSPALVSPTLLVVDLRDMMWNADAWRAVALRDYRHRQPWVKDATANELRRLIGETAPSNLHCVAVVDAWTLFRQSANTNETATYYDLLFARQRFPQGGQVWVKTGERTVAHGGGEFVHPPGTRRAGERQTLAAGKWAVEDGRWERGTAAKFVDFPATFQEWLTAFGADATVSKIDADPDFLRVRHGAVCPGRQSAPDGSYVTEHTRLVWYTSGVPTGWLAQTFDVFDESGETDLYENAFTDERADRPKVKFDAGEALLMHPAGDAVAGMLYNSAFKRVERADERAAHHTRDKADPIVNPGVDCMVCHAEHYGLIPLNNRLEADVPGEVDARFKSVKGADGRTRARNFRGFFLGDWQRQLVGPRDVVRLAWEDATADRGPLLPPKVAAGKPAVKPGSWDGTKFGAALLKWKNKYDEPVDTGQQERETGYPAALLRLAASKIVAGKNADGKDAGGRMADVARGRPVPRQTWDRDTFPILMSYLEAKAFELDKKPEGAP